MVSIYGQQSQSTLKWTPAQTILQRQVCKIHTLLPIFLLLTKYSHIYTEQCLASSELLNPHPLSTQRVCPPTPTVPKAGGYTLAGR